MCAPLSCLFSLSLFLVLPLPHLSCFFREKLRKPKDCSCADFLAELWTRPCCLGGRWRWLLKAPSWLESRKGAERQGGRERERDRREKECHNGETRFAIIRQWRRKETTRCEQAAATGNVVGQKKTLWGFKPFCWLHLCCHSKQGRQRRRATRPFLPTSISCSATANTRFRA